MVIRRGYVEWADGQIHYRSGGRSGGQARGTPLVLLHQTASSSAMYAGVMEALAGEYRMLALDTPGYGMSDAPPGPPTIRYYATALLEALERLGVQEFHAFGFHTGASIACEMAVVAPTRLQSVMLCGLPYADAEERSHWRSKLAGEMREHLPQVTVAPMVIQPDGSHLSATWRRLQGMGTDPAPALLQRETIDVLRAGERYLEAVVAVFNHDLPTALAQVRCPILLICGDRDVLYPYQQPAGEARPDAGCVTVPGGGQYLIDEQPALVAAEIRRFLSGIPAAR